jgi:hypothetical protein
VRGVEPRPTEKIESLRRACRRISPLREDYAKRPIRDGFGWSSSLSGCAFERLYLVVFRSVLRPEADLGLLHEHDERAHQEAIRSGGLLRYFKGEADERGQCVSFCLWESRGQAIGAAGAASHRSAAAISGQMYESYELERYWLKKVATAGGEGVDFEPIGAA